MSDKTIAEVLMAKMKYEGEIEKFLREKVDEFTKETGIPVRAINVENSTIEITPTGNMQKMYMYKIAETKFDLDWEGSE